MLDLRAFRIILACMALVLVGTVLSLDLMLRLTMLASKPVTEQGIVPDYTDPSAPCNNLT